MISLINVVYVCGMIIGKQWWLFPQVHRELATQVNIENIWHLPTCKIHYMNTTQGAGTEYLARHRETDYDMTPEVICFLL